jgi:hypothetical protein
MARASLLTSLCALVVVALVGCSSSSAPRAEPLAVKADGTIDATQVDLAGTPGVTSKEQHTAEVLLRSTIVDIQRWNDVAQAKRDGFASIGDSFTGSEHFVHWDWINDNQILDPNRPESLVYKVKPDGKRVLEAAMYILPPRYTLDSVPDIGGPLTQFHIHNVLCFDQSAVPRFHRPVRPDGTCPVPFVKRLTTPMIHVWIRQNKCGPFAPIGGIASGAVKTGEQVECDPKHGSPTDI